MKRVALLCAKNTEHALETLAQYRVFGDALEWAGYKFEINPKYGKFDGIVALQSMRPFEEPFYLTAPPSKTLLISLEPPSLLYLPEGFCQQFNKVLSQDERIPSSLRIAWQSGHSWFAERGLKDILIQEELTKLECLSACVSAKTGPPLAEQRIEFLNSLSQSVPEFRWFGRGAPHPIETKLEALSTFKYHIVIENSRVTDYFTEKIFDAFVCDCAPFYDGCPNLSDYFPDGAFIPIDVFDIDTSIERIKYEISNGFFERSRTARHQAKFLCALQYNQFPTIVGILQQMPTSKARELSFKPHNRFSFSFRQRGTEYFKRLFPG